jgi:hypothetical protein
MPRLLVGDLTHTEIFEAENRIQLMLIQIPRLRRRWNHYLFPSIGLATPMHHGHWKDNMIIDDFDIEQRRDRY